MRNNIQKIESIQEKIKQLKSEQSEIEAELIDYFVQVLKIKDAFQIDFDSMVGGVLETIDTIRSDPLKAEAWRLSGTKFRKTKTVDKSKRVKELDCEVENQYV